MDIQNISESRFTRLVNSRQTAWVLGGLLLVILIGHLLTLMIYPLVFIDEGWLANTSWSWLQTGVPFDLIHTGPLDQFGYPWLTDNFLGQLPYTIAYALFGVGLGQTRFVTFLFSLVLIFATIQVGRRSYNLNVGLLAGVLLALSTPYLFASRQRQDIMLAAMIMISFWLALYALEKDKIWAHFLAGLILGIGFDVQQTSIVFIPALAVLYITHYGKRFLFARGVWIVGIGGAIGLVYYAATHMLPNLEVYNKLMTFYFAPGADSQVPLTHPSLIPESIIREFARYRFRENVFDLFVIALTGLFLLFRRTAADRRLLIYTGVGFISFSLLSGNKTTLYGINLYSFFMLIAAAGFVGMIQSFASAPSLKAGVESRGLFPSVMAKLSQGNRGTWLAGLAGLLLVTFIGVSLLQTVIRVYNSREYDYYAITNRIREVIPPDKRVLGMPTWWFGFTEYDYRSGLNVPYYEFFNGYNVRQAIDAIRPDYIIVDDTQQVILVDEGQELPQGMNVYSVSRADFQEVLETQGEKVLEFTTTWHGSFEIYRLDWSS